MLSTEDNQLLTQTGPGTPMGQYLRRYWIPALMAEELPDDGCAPVRIKLLGEDLIAVRGADGKTALVEEFCPHRRVSLFFGRNESSDNSPDGQNGLRCSYHGWKYHLETGACIDMPSEPPNSRFKEHIKVVTYPLVLRGDVYWVYMGPPEKQPPVPEFEWTTVSFHRRHVSKRIQHANYFQAMEGGIDSSHVSFLHNDAELWRPDWKRNRRRDHGAIKADTSPRFFLEPTDYGVLIGARRELEDDRYYWRITPWTSPWYTQIPWNGDDPAGAHAWVPADDDSCWAWSIDYHPDRDLRKEEIDFIKLGLDIHPALQQGTFETIQNAGNNYLQSRALQRWGSMTGIAGITMQDAALQESMGPIVDRNNENLGSSDAAIIGVRKRLLAEIRALQNNPDAVPPGIDPETHHIRSYATALQRDEPWVEATAGARTGLRPVPAGEMTGAGRDGTP